MSIDRSIKILNNCNHKKSITYLNIPKHQFNQNMHKTPKLQTGVVKMKEQEINIKYEHTLKFPQTQHMVTGTILR